MAKTRNELQNQLDNLDKGMPSLIRENPLDEDFWPAFSRASDFIVEDAESFDYDWVLIKLERILVKHGKMPFDDDLPLSQYG
jgi:hypothetical protein